MMILNHKQLECVHNLLLRILPSYGTPEVVKLCREFMYRKGLMFK